MNMLQYCLIIVLLPLLSSIIAGIFRHVVGRAGAHTITIAAMTMSFALSSYVAFMVLTGAVPALNSNL